MSCQEKSL